MLTLVNNRPGVLNHHAMMRSNRLKTSTVYQADDYNKQMLRVVDSIQRRARFANSLLQYKVERLEAQILRTRRHMQMQAVRKRQRHATTTNIVVTNDINNNNRQGNKDTQNNNKGKDKGNNNDSTKDNANKSHDDDEDKDTK